ncbi:hypothetical protein BG22_10590 [Bifidobacterium sp. UTBIF-78]|nr:hypothetical protein BG22_10590 [Bifidobacterium sp. UTBIF-78]
MNGGAPPPGFWSSSRSLTETLTEMMTEKNTGARRIRRRWSGKIRQANGFPVAGGGRVGLDILVIFSVAD